MGYRISSSTAVLVNAAASLAVETIIATTNAVIQPADGSVIAVWWYMAVTIGTAGTGLIMRMRRGTTLTGVLLNGAPSLTVVAGNTVLLSGMLPDIGAALGPTQYSITLQVTAATANSPVADVTLFAAAL